MGLPRWLMDPLIRRKARVERADLDAYVVRVARTVPDYESAFSLVRTAYVFLGIESLASPPLRMTDQHVLPEATVLVASEGAGVVGTMTVTADSDAGLPLDKDYKTELDALRRQGARLAEFGSLAIVARCHHTGVTTLMNIAAIRIAREYDRATHIVMGVHPKAAPVYRALWGFQPLGTTKTHANLKAPVASMVLELATLEAFLRRVHTQPMKSGWLPADHFFGARLPCIHLPPDGMSGDDLVRWQLPREVFRELFLRRSQLLEKLPEPTRKYLETRRSKQTLRRLTAVGMNALRRITGQQALPAGPPEEVDPPSGSAT